MIFLPSYTMGGIGAGRLLNVVWMTFVLGLAATELLLLGWLERVRGISLHGVEAFCRCHAKQLPLAAGCMLVLMACIGSHTVKELSLIHIWSTASCSLTLPSPRRSAS